MNGKKLFWFDTETTGLDPIKNDILTLAGVYEVDGKIIKGIDLKIKPFSYENISKEALEVNKLTLEQIKTFDEPLVAYKKLIAFFNSCVNRYDKSDKMIPAGYNVMFDVNFLFEFFKKCNDLYCGSYIDYHKLDVATIVLFFKIQGYFDFHGFKLEKVAKQLEIPIIAHDAKEDILATRKVYYKLMEKIEIKL